MPEPYDLRSMSDPETLSRHARDRFPSQQEPHHGAHEVTSVREAVHHGRHIRIETSYRITVDGQPVTGHIMVGNDGRVHYHAIPNQEFESAVDMVKRVIDLTPPDMSHTDPEPDHGPGHGGHH
jgi:hypothetical protein